MSSRSSVRCHSYRYHWGHVWQSFLFGFAPQDKPSTHFFSSQSGLSQYIKMHLFWMLKDTSFSLPEGHPQALRQACGSLWITFSLRIYKIQESIADISKASVFWSPNLDLIARHCTCVDVCWFLLSGGNMLDTNPSCRQFPCSSSHLPGISDEGMAPLLKFHRW